MINPAGDEKKSMTKSMHNGSTTPSIWGLVVVFCSRHKNLKLEP
jgi:hypothetical protein